MSLTEVLVATLVMGLMITTLAMATRVIIQQADNTEGRANNARSEQNVGLYMPADLSSAEIVNVEPGAVPCGPTPACPPGVDLGGSNALMLTWSGQEFDVRDELDRLHRHQRVVPRDPGRPGVPSDPSRVRRASWARS